MRLSRPRAPPLALPIAICVYAAAMSDIAFPFPVLVCDTGGTNVRFSLVSEPGGALGTRRPSHHRRLSGPARGARGGGAEARSAPALDDRLRRGAGRGADFEAHQRALGDGRARDGAPRRPRARAAAQRFRGAGADAAGHSAGLVAPDRPARLRKPRPAGHSRAGDGPRRRRADRIEGRHTPVSSEACHIDFGPVSPEEYALWPHLERAHGRVTSESVITGEGLARVHRARMMALGRPIRISIRPRSLPPRSPTGRAMLRRALRSTGASSRVSPATWR